MAQAEEMKGFASFILSKLPLPHIDSISLKISLGFSIPDKRVLTAGVGGQGGPDPQLTKGLEPP